MANSLHRGFHIYCKYGNFHLVGSRYVQWVRLYFLCISRFDFDITQTRRNYHSGLSLMEQELKIEPILLWLCRSTSHHGTPWYRSGDVLNTPKVNQLIYLDSATVPASITLTPGPSVITTTVNSPVPTVTVTSQSIC